MEGDYAAAVDPLIVEGQGAVETEATLANVEVAECQLYRRVAGRRNDECRQCDYYNRKNTRQVNM